MGKYIPTQLVENHVSIFFGESLYTYTVIYIYTYEPYMILSEMVEERVPCALGMVGVVSDLLHHLLGLLPEKSCHYRSYCRATVGIS